jgi:hypothetical protein
MSDTRIHWARILLGGLLAEVALILAIVPLGLRFGDNFLQYTAPPLPCRRSRLLVDIDSRANPSLARLRAGEPFLLQNRRRCLVRYT